MGVTEECSDRILKELYMIKAKLWWLEDVLGDLGLLSNNRVASAFYEIVTYVDIEIDKIKSERLREKEGGKEEGD